MMERKTTMADYGDHELFGPRGETNKLVGRLKLGNDSECILFSQGTFAAKDQFKLKDLIGIDKRLKQMIQGLGVEHPMPVQRYSWSKIHNSPFANIFISSESTGKTYAHLLYAVSKCIIAAPITEVKEALNGDTSCHVTSDNCTPEDLINHPKFIIVCSSQDKVDAIHRFIDRMKEQAYGTHVTDTKRYQFAPIARTISIHHENDKLAFRCSESEILISSPPALVKCLEEGYVSFSKSKKVFFDDLDIALQIQNNNIRELIKIYLIQNDNSNKSCQMHMFSQKWTNLVKQFLSSVFPQRTVLFSSIAEAAIYANVRFEVECFNQSGERTLMLSSLINVLATNNSYDKIAIVCQTDAEAEEVSLVLSKQGHVIKVLRDDQTTGSTDTKTQTSRNAPSHTRTTREARVYVISDSALEFEVEYSTRRRPLNDIMHLIHLSLPNDMITFDQRFRLMYRSIQDCKSGMTSTLVLQAKSTPNLARQIYDLASRSASTLKSTRCLLKDLVPSKNIQICWRWATSGMCRLEKLSREDRFGSYCPDRHSLLPLANVNEERHDGSIKMLPANIMVRIYLTHVINPNEFYFWFESYKTEASGTKWVQFQSSGFEYMKQLQSKLDKFKETKPRSIPLANISKGNIYAVYFPQESRVDRVVILDEPKHSVPLNEEIEYSKQVPVFKIDYGTRIDVYVKNLIQLPVSLTTSVPPKCHRGLHIGFKPIANEPNWSYKSKKRFYDLLCSHQNQDITAWIRMNRDNCFWFEDMLISRRLSNIDSNDIFVINPFKELLNAKLADPVNMELPFLPRSNRLEILCKWNNEKLISVSQDAFIRRDIDTPEIFLTCVRQNLDICVRQTVYNKQLLDLEDEFYLEYKNKRLIKQEYLAIGALCLAKINATTVAGKEPTVDSDEVCLNRARIENITSPKKLVHKDMESPESIQESMIQIECVDHGDRYLVKKNDLFQASTMHIKKLPFQAITCKLANLNEHLIPTNREDYKYMSETLYDMTRINEEMVKLKCKLNSQGHLYLFVPVSEHNGTVVAPVSQEEANVYLPLYQLLPNKIKLHRELDEVCKSRLAIDQDSEKAYQSDGHSGFVELAILKLLRDIVLSEMENNNK